jgi:hypothetical protein
VVRRHFGGPGGVAADFEGDGIQGVTLIVHQGEGMISRLEIPRHVIGGRAEVGAVKVAWGRKTGWMGNQGQMSWLIGISLMVTDASAQARESRWWPTLRRLPRGFSSNFSVSRRAR